MVGERKELREEVKDKRKQQEVGIGRRLWG